MMKNSWYKIAVAVMLLASPSFSLAGDSEWAGKDKSAYDQANYIVDCIREPECSMALMQIWSKNGGEVSMSHFLPSKDKIPALFRGTDMEGKMMEMGAVNKCNPNDQCRAFLVEATKTIRSLPPEELKKIYQAKAEYDWSRSTRDLESQVGKNLAAAISKGAEPLPLTPAKDVAATNSLQAGSATVVSSEQDSIIDYAHDPYGNVTIQLVKLANGNREIRKRTAEGTKLLATVVGREGKWLIEPVGAQPIDAIDVQLTSQGFIAGTRSRMVAYSDKSGLVDVSWPLGFHTAAIQRGDVPLTGSILLERDNKGGSSLLGAIAGFGQTLGVSRSEDYMLFNLQTGKAFPLNISLDGKQVAIPYNCKARNALINTCRDADVRERLTDRMGFKNTRHYAWAAYWFRAPSGVYLIALEDGGRNVTVTNIESGEKRVAFSRSLGITDFQATQEKDGRISINAQWMFANHEVKNLEAEFAQLPLPDAGKKEQPENASAKQNKEEL